MVTTTPFFYDFFFSYFTQTFGGDLIIAGSAIILGILILLFYNRINLAASLLLGLVLLDAMACPAINQLCDGVGYFSSIEFAIILSVVFGANLLLAGYALLRKFGGV